MRNGKKEPSIYLPRSQNIYLLELKKKIKKKRWLNLSKQFVNPIKENKKNKKLFLRKISHTYYALKYNNVLQYKEI